MPYCYPTHRPSLGLASCVLYSPAYFQSPLVPGNPSLLLYQDVGSFGLQVSYFVGRPSVSAGCLLGFADSGRNTADVMQCSQGVASRPWRL